MQANSFSNLQANLPTQTRSCHHCGSQLTHFARFCGECGASGMNTGPASVVNFASVQAISPMQSLLPAPQFEDYSGNFQYS
ncbi:zinc-ribbon domain-containing protein, partial [Acinetobacter baumannii]